MKIFEYTEELVLMHVNLPQLEATVEDSKKASNKTP